MYAGGYSDDDSDNDYMYTSFDEIKRSGNLPKEEIVVPVKSNEERLVTAAYDGDLTTIKDIFENDTGFSVNTVLPGSKSALMIAASYSYSHIVEYLLEKGADADQQCEMETPLMCACASISTQIIASVQCVSSILAKKVRVNIGDKYGQTALMKACQSGKVDIVNILLKLSNIDAQDRRGKTAIFYAVTGDHPDVVRVLAEKGALKDPHICSNVKLCMLSKRSPKVAAIISEYIAPDEDEPEETNILSATEKWPDLFPGILSKDKPAFYFDVPLILFGMNCERLIPLFTEKGVSLAKLLCIDEQTLIKLGVTMPYERKKVFKGLRKFHLHKWNMETVLGIAANKRRKFMAETSLTDLGAWFRILTVLESSIYFNNDRITSEVPNPHQNAKLLRAASDNYNNIIDTKKELKKWKRNILRITQKNLPPPDLIVPNNPLSAKSFTKTKITFGVWSAVIITVLYVCIKR